MYRPRSEFDDMHKHLYLDLITQGMGRQDACRSLGFSPGTATTVMKSDPDFRVAVEVAERLLVEAVEKKLADAALQREEPWAIKMLLERLDRSKWGPESRLQVDQNVTVNLLSKPHEEAIAELEATMQERTRQIQEVSLTREDDNDEQEQAGQRVADWEAAGRLEGAAERLGDSDE